VEVIIFIKLACDSAFCVAMYDINWRAGCPATTWRRSGAFNLRTISCVHSTLLQIRRGENSLSENVATAKKKHARACLETHKLSGAAKTLKIAGMPNDLALEGRARDRYCSSARRPRFLARAMLPLHSLTHLDADKVF